MKVKRKIIFQAMADFGAKAYIFWLNNEIPTLARGALAIEKGRVSLQEAN